MSKVRLSPRPALYPVPVVLVGSGHEERKNIMTAAWTGVLASDPPAVGVSVQPKRHTHGLIEASGEFTLNIPETSLVEALRFAGRESGRDVDKFRALGLSAETCPTLEHAPGVGQCPVILGCRVTHTIHLGSHDLFVGEVIDLLVEERVVGEDEKIDPTRMDLVCFASGHYLEALSRDL